MGQYVETSQGHSSTDPILQFFSPAVKSTIQADASQHGLGAYLTQKGKPVAHAFETIVKSHFTNFSQIATHVTSPSEI